jgi:hypothetical protein
MKNISGQYQDLLEGRMTQFQFLRNARMMFPSFVTNHNSFEDSVTILKQKGMLTEGDAVKGTPDKAPEYDYPTQPGKYKKVEQSPEVDDQDGIYPSTTLTDIPKEKVSKRVVSKTRPDGLEDIKDKDTKNEMKKVRVVKEAFYKGATDEIKPKGNLNDKLVATLFDGSKIKLDVKETGTGFNLRSTGPASVPPAEFTPEFVLKAYSTIYQPTKQDIIDIKAFVKQVKGEDTLDENDENKRSFDDIYGDFIETDDATEIKAYFKAKGKEAVDKLKAKGKEAIAKFKAKLGGENLKETKSTSPSLRERLKPIISKLIQEVIDEDK